MKRTFLLFLAVLLLIPGFATAAPAKKESQKPEPVILFINGKKTEINPKPLLQNDVVYIPLSVLRQMKLPIKLDNKRLTIKKDYYPIVLSLGSKIIKANDEVVRLSHPATTINGQFYIPIEVLDHVSGLGIVWNKDKVELKLYDWIPLVEDAVDKEDAEEVKELIRLGANPSFALMYSIQNETPNIEIVNIALDAIDNILEPANYFDAAVKYKQTEIVRLMLEKGKVTKERAPKLEHGLSYIGSALGKWNLQQESATARILPEVTTPPSGEVAQLLYEHGFEIVPLDVYEALASRNTQNLEWLLSHGADPNGETVKLVYLDDTEKNIYFHAYGFERDPQRKQKLIVSAYEITSWNPSLENMQNLNLLIVNYKTNLDPLTQAQKDRLLELALSNTMQELANVLREAGAK